MQISYEQNESRRSRDEVLHLERELNNLKEIHGQRRAKRMSQISKIKGLNLDQRASVFDQLGNHISKLMKSETVPINDDDVLAIDSPLYKTANNPISSSRKKKAKKIIKKRVIIEDIKNEVDTLRIKLQFERITLDHVCKTIEDKCDSENTISIEELKQVLSEHPFSVTDQKTAEQIARYMIEDNSDYKVVYNLQQRGELVFLMAVVRRMLQYYTLLTDSDLVLLYDTMHNRLSLNYKRMGYDMAGMKTKLGERCSKDQLLVLISNHDIAKDSPEADYVLVKLYEVSRNLQKLPYFELFQIFKTEPPSEDD